MNRVPCAAFAMLALLQSPATASAQRGCYVRLPVRSSEVPDAVAQWRMRLERLLQHGADTGAVAFVFAPHDMVSHAVIDSVHEWLRSAGDSVPVRRDVALGLQALMRGTEMGLGTEHAWAAARLYARLNLEADGVLFMLEDPQSDGRLRALALEATAGSTDPSRLAAALTASLCVIDARARGMATLMAGRDLDGLITPDEFAFALRALTRLEQLQASLAVPVRLSRILPRGSPVSRFSARWARTVF